MKEVVKGEYPKGPKQLSPGTAKLFRIEKILRWVSKQRSEDKLSELRSPHDIALDPTLDDSQRYEEFEMTQRISHLAVSEILASDSAIERTKAKAIEVHREVAREGVRDPDQGSWSFGAKDNGVFYVQAYEPGQEFLLGVECFKRISKRLRVNVNFSMTSDGVYGFSVSFQRRGRKPLGYASDDTSIGEMNSDHQIIVEEMFDNFLGHCRLPVVSSKSLGN